MQLYRDTCQSISIRKSGYSVICAKVIYLIPFTVEDSTGRVSFDITQGPEISIGDVAYFLLFFVKDKLSCQRFTVVPADILPVALYQVEVSQDIENKDDSYNGRRSLVRFASIKTVF